MMVSDASDAFPMDDTKSFNAPDFFDAVDAEIGAASGFDSIEGNLALWLDAANINGRNNAGLTDDQAIDTWFDMSGNGNNMTAHGAKYSTNKVVLDGSNDISCLLRDKSEFNFLHHTESTVYVVLKRDSDVGYDVVIDTGGYSRARTGFSYALRPAANEYPYLHISNPNLSDLIEVQPHIQIEFHWPIQT